MIKSLRHFSVVLALKKKSIESFFLSLALFCTTPYMNSAKEMLTVYNLLQYEYNYISL